MDAERREELQDVPQWLSSGTATQVGDEAVVEGRGELSSSQHLASQFRAPSRLYDPAFIQAQAPGVADMIRRQKEVGEAAERST